MTEATQVCCACGETTDSGPIFGAMHLACVRRVLALGQTHQQVRHERDRRIGEEAAHFDT